MLWPTWDSLGSTQLVSVGPVPTDPDEEEGGATIQRQMWEQRTVNTRDELCIQASSLVRGSICQDRLL